MSWDDGPELFRELQDRVRRAGLFQSKERYYLCKIGMTLVLSSAGWTAFVLVGQSWWQLLVAALLGFGSVQTALVVHDAGHTQVCRSGRSNRMICQLHANLLLGVSAAWWVQYHNRHHNHPNDMVRDPSVRRLATIFKRVDSRSSGSSGRIVVRGEPYLFFPRYAFAALGLRLASVLSLVRRHPRAARRFAIESLLMAIHYLAYVSVVTWRLDGALLIGFVVAHYALSGLYFGAVVAPNHTGMPMMDTGATGWVQRQLLTTRNLRPSPVVDYLFGGLNYQIEHHLFPSMARPNLRRCRPVVKEFCRDRGLPYHETGVVTAYVEIVRYLRRVSGA